MSSPPSTLQPLRFEQDPAWFRAASKVRSLRVLAPTEAMPTLGHTYYPSTNSIGLRGSTMDPKWYPGKPVVWCEVFVAAPQDYLEAVLKYCEGLPPAHLRHIEVLAGKKKRKGVKWLQAKRVDECLSDNGEWVRC